MPGGRVAGWIWDSFIVLVQAALKGEGIALGWRYMMDDYLASHLLVPAADFCMRLERGYFCVTQKERPVNPSTAAFVDWITTRGQSDAAEERPHRERSFVR